MSPVELPNDFMRAHNFVAVSTVAQNMAKYTRRAAQAAVVIIRCHETIHHGMIEECPVGNHYLYEETAIRNKSLVI